MTVIAHNFHRSEISYPFFNLNILSHKREKNQTQTENCIETLILYETYIAYGILLKKFTWNDIIDNVKRTGPT